MDNKYLYDMVMSKLCDICVKLTAIQKDINCIKEQPKSKLHCEIKHTDTVISVKGEYYDD